MMFVNATVFMAQLSRSITASVFKQDTKEEIRERYMRQLGAGVASSILDRLLVMVHEEDRSGGISVRVSLAPFGNISYTHDHCDISSVEGLCDKLAELTVLVLKTH